MISRVVRGSMKFRFLVVPVAAALMVLGIVQLHSMPVDVFPEYAPPTVQIQTEALGLSAAEVEQLITVPMEADLLNGVAWLDEIRSESVPGLSSIELIFEPGTDIMRARQLVQERMTQAHALPQVSKPPTMLQPLSATSRVMMVGLSSKDVSLVDLSVLARWKIKPRLLGVPGVANVSIWGQRERQLQVQVDPEQLRSNGVSLLQVMKTTANAMWVSPLSFVEASTPGTGGFIDTPNQRIGIQHILPIKTPRDLATVTVEGPGTDERSEETEPNAESLRLGDVARVVEDHQPLIGDGVVKGSPSLVLVVEKFPGESTPEVTERVESALAALAPGLSGITVDTTVYRPATFVEASVGNLLLAAVLGLVLLMLLLIGFLFSWRTALTCLVAVPLSLLASVLVLSFQGATFNAMVAVGLVMATCVVVGDAVLGSETIERRLREHRSGGSERSTVGALVAAVAEAYVPLVTAALVIVAATVPLFFLTGVADAFSTPLAVTYLLAVLASMVIAVTVTPVIALLLAPRSQSAVRAVPPVVVRMQRGYDGLLARTMAKPRLPYTLAGVAVLAALIVAPFSAQSLLPTAKETDVLIQWEGNPGTSYPAMARITAAASRELQEVPGVRNVGGHVGRAVTSDRVSDVSSTEMWVSIDPDADFGDTMRAITAVAAGYPGLTPKIGSYPDERVREFRTGANADIVARIYGDDPKVLSAKAAEIRALIGGVDGVVDARAEAPAQEPTVEVEVRLDAARENGIKPGDVRRAAATLLSGVLVGNIFEEQKIFEVVVWGAPSTRSSLTSVRDLLIDTPAGGHVRLADVADVRVAPNPTVVRRNAVSRYVDVTAEVSGRSVGATKRDVADRLENVTFPVEHHVEVLETSADRQSPGRLFGVGIVVAILIFLLFQAALQSWRLATVAFLSLPVAATGGVLAGFADSRVLSLASFAGLLVVVGIAARYCLVLLRTLQQSQHDEEATAAQTVLRGAGERLGPIVTTSLATALVLLPLLFVGDIFGSEPVRQLAIVVLGGLVTTTLLYLFVVPPLYLRFAAATQPERP